MFAFAAVFLLQGAVALVPARSQLAFHRQSGSRIRTLPSQASASVATNAPTSPRGLVARHAEAVAASEAEPASLDKCAMLKYTVAIATQVRNFLATQFISLEVYCFD